MSEMAAPERGATMRLHAVNFKPDTGELIVTWGERVFEEQIFESMDGRRIPTGRKITVERTITERAQEGTPEFDTLRLRLLTEVSTRGFLHPPTLSQKQPD